MSGESTPSDEIPKGAEGVEWAVSCPRHGSRAHLYMEGLKDPEPKLLHCSLRPGEFPPPCDRACLDAFQLRQAQADGGGDTDLEETVADG